MSKVEEALWKDYKEVSDLIDDLVIVENTEEYKIALQERDNLRNELIKLKQIEQEKNVKITQIESDNKREKIRNGITIGTFVVTTGVSVYTIAKTFKFDQVATVTSTLGRNILNGVVPKMLKR